MLKYLGVHRFRAPFVSEGGALVSDGRGTVLATESSIIERERNPGQGKQELGDEILAYMGATKMLWVPGLAGHDITDDHIDGLARFVGSNKVVVNQPFDPEERGPWGKSERLALSILEQQTNADGRKLDCLTIREPGEIPPGERPQTFADEYVNWYVCNDAVLIASFDDALADAEAREFVAGLYPGRAIEQLRIDTLAAGGGGIHCATQQQPAV